MSIWYMNYISIKLFFFSKERKGGREKERKTELGQTQLHYLSAV